jgi:hypothetical protein
MRKLYLALAITMLVCLGCEWHLRSGAAGGEATKVSIERYDLIETLYLTTGDYAALGQLNTSYPRQTRMLIEDILQLGKVDDPNINQKFLHFFQDSTLQTMLADVQHQYADMDDISLELETSFLRLKEELPEIELPQIYTQIGSFDESIVVGNNTLGISLDKYLGADYPFYMAHYTEEQRHMMDRSMIVPDCLGFYVLSLYPFPAQLQVSQTERDQHMGVIQYVVNKITERAVFQNEWVNLVDAFVKRNPQMTISQLLSVSDSTFFKK